MGKYALVASYYDSYVKMFKNEKIVNINDMDFSKLEEIDAFTSNHGWDELWTLISQENVVLGLNFLSIKYMKTPESRPIYYKVLVNNKIISSCVGDLSLCKDVRGRYSYLVNKNNEFFQQEKKKLLNLIENKNLEMINYIFGDKNNYLVFLIRRYLNSFYDYNEQDKKIQDLAMIILEFSRYKVFRGWIVSNLKNKDNNYSKKNNGEFCYNKKFRVGVGVDLGKECFFDDLVQVCYEYNTRNLDEDKEEFIEPCELEQMGFDYREIGFSKKLRK